MTLYWPFFYYILIRFFLFFFFFFVDGHGIKVKDHVKVKNTVSLNLVLYLMCSLLW